MRIQTTTLYADYDHNSWCDCYRAYCNEHRLLWLSCESENNDCPKCNHDWQMKHEKALWEKDQKERHHAA